MELTKLKVIHRAELAKIGKKSVSIQGYRNDLVEEHLQWHFTQMSNKWCSIECMAKTMFGRNTETNRAGIRKRMAATFRTLLERRSLFLVIEYDASTDGHGRIKACKLFEDGAGVEGEYALRQIERMTQRRQITEEMRDRALSVIGKS